MRAKRDPTLKYIANVVDFGEHSNNEIQRAVLPRTESDYSHTLRVSLSPGSREASRSIMPLSLVLSRHFKPIRANDR